MHLTRMYRIQNGEFYELMPSNGKMELTPTGVKAFYTKKEMCVRYGWSKKLLRAKLLEPISDYIYDIDIKGYYITTKRVFSPIEIEYIVTYFGLP